MVRSRDHDSLSRAFAAPATTSEWPLRYLVAECMTMSAPSASGRREHQKSPRWSRHADSAGGLRDLRHRRDVGDGPERIARRLDPEQSGLAGPHRAHRVKIGGLDETDAVAVTADSGAPAEAPIHHFRGDDVGDSLAPAARSPPPPCPSRTGRLPRRLRAWRSGPRPARPRHYRCGRRRSPRDNGCPRGGNIEHMDGLIGR